MKKRSTRNDEVFKLKENRDLKAVTKSKHGVNINPSAKDIKGRLAIWTVIIAALTSWGFNLEAFYEFIIDVVAMFTD